MGYVGFSCWSAGLIEDFRGDRSAGRRFRLPWLVAGLICVVLGGVGVVVPGLPTTVFFIGAAACFGRSSTRLERWVLELPGIGPAVKDYRDGLGMPRMAKVLAVASITCFCGLALVIGPSHIAVRAALLAAGACGVAFVTLGVPTRERVLAARTTGGPVVESEEPEGGPLQV
jgi:uncharacterized membrane protein YbaN (DUF454 family)